MNHESKEYIRGAGPEKGGQKEQTSLSGYTEVLKQRIQDFIVSVPEGIDKKQFLLDQIAIHGNTLAAGKENEFQQVLDKIAAKTYSTDEDLIDDTVREFIQFFGANFSPQEFERRVRDLMRSHDNFIPLGRERIFSCSLYEDTIDLHLQSAQTLDNRELLRAFKQAMNELAFIVRGNESIQKISTTSWIVAKYPRIISSLGFRIEGPISQKVRQEGFSNEARKVASASMTRAEFLEKYGD